MMDKTANANPPVSSPVLSTDHNLILIAKGGGITFAGKIFLTGSRFFIAFILVRLLGAEQFGLYNLALSVSTISVGLAVFGLDSALVRYIAILASRKDEEGVWGALQIGVGGAMLFSVVTGTVIFALAYPIAESVFNAPQLVPLLQLVGVIVPVLALSEVLAGACRGFKRMDYPVIAQSIAQPLIRLILILALLVVGLNATLAIVTYALADLSASVVLLYFLNREFSLWRSFRKVKREFRAILTFSLTYWLSEMMLKFKNNIQTILIGSLNNITGVGIFSLASQITAVSGDFSSAINTSAKPIMAELHDRQDFKQMERIYQTSNKWVVMLQLPVFLVMVLFPEQILSIFGNSFIHGASALIILALADLISVGTGMGSIIIDMTGHTKLKLINSVIRIIIYVVLNFFLIPRFGIVGAAISVLVGEAVINVLRLVEVFILFRILPYNKTFIKPVIAIGVAMITTMLLGVWLPPTTNILTIILHIFMIFAMYVGASLVMGLSADERIMLARIRQRLVRTISRA
jgi:O-antigen/teichoic acid export membrane protein